jgi:hypothetical protein
MTVRPFDLLDLPLVPRYRDEALILDGIRELTRGNPLGVFGILAYLNPSRQIYVAIHEDNGGSLLGGITHSRGELFAKLLFLAPKNNLKDANLLSLLENLASEAGNWGAVHVIAEIVESSNVFHDLRKAGFSVYAWQRMWDISHLDTMDKKPKSWRTIRSVQRPTVQSLYYQIVPPLLHPVEPLSNSHRGLICDGEENCVVYINSGANGIVLTPLIHPETILVDEKLSSLLNCLPERRGRPVYLCIRSYQAWLEPVLADLGALAAAQRQAVMVKHLAHMVKDEQAISSVPKGVSVQPSQIGRIETTNYNDQNA